ncbi:MAG: hypothetical protein HPY65_09575 [Syntrophaceae bacterium]|nr:hypothetical protein [Syntrophaceae bacterium]
MNAAVTPDRQTFSASVAGSETQRQTRSATPEAVQPAATAGVEKAALRTKKISSSAPFEVRRAESDSAQAAAKGQDNKPAAASQTKQAATDAPAFREAVEQTSQPGIEKAGPGSAGEVQGMATAAKTDSPSVQTSSASLRDSSSVLKQASDSWTTAAEKHGTDGGRVRIVLSPDHLGGLDMNVRVRKEAVEIMMSVQREDSLKTMQGHAAELRTALSDQGLRVESLSMQTSGRDFQSNSGPSGGYGGPYDGRNMSESGGQGAGSGRRDGEQGASTPLPAKMASQRIARDGISVFA